MFSEEKYGPGKATTRVGLMRPDFRQWFQRVMWLLVIWVASVSVLGVAAWILRMFMQSVGMSPPDT